MVESEKKLNLLIDIDGVMTTGQFLYSEKGKAFKVFGPHDADGLKIIRDKINILFISADKRGFPISKKRIGDMKYKIELVPDGSRYEWIKDNFGFENTIFIGDGIPDAPVIPVVRHSSLAYDITQRLFSLLLSQPPVLHIRYINQTKELDELAEELELWNTAVDLEQRKGHDPWQALAQDMIVFGRGVSDIEYIPHLWKDFPIKEHQSPSDYLTTVDSFTQGAGLPFVWRHIPAKQFIPVESEGRITGGYWFGAKKAIDVLQDKRNKVPKLKESLIMETSPL